MMNSVHTIAVLIVVIGFLTGCPTKKQKQAYLKCMEENPQMENNDAYCDRKSWGL